MKDPIKLKTIFMGTSLFAADILEVLLKNNYNIISVYTGADKKSGPKKEIEKAAVKMLAEEKSLKIFEPKKFDEETIRELSAQEPDLIIVAAYGKILPGEVLRIPGFGALNVHPSLLPKYRGPSPLQNALLEGEDVTGTTIILMDENVDTGDILFQEKIFIDPQDNYVTLLEKAANVSSELLLKTLPLWVERKITPQKQDETQATNCQLIERSDGRIIWTDSAVSVYNRARAFSPWPGIFTYLEKNGTDLRLKLHKISLPENMPPSNHKIGEVFKLNEDIAVMTGEGLIILEEIQLEGKDKIGVKDFVNGYPEFIGSVLK